MSDIVENTAGALMTPEFLRLREGTSAGDGLRAVRASGLDSDAMYTIYVTGARETLLGAVELRKLLFADEGAPVEALMDAHVHSLRASDDQIAAARLVRKYDLMSVPVVDEGGALVGAIGVNSIVEVIEEENTEDFERMAALVPSEESYMSSGAWTLAVRRIPWLLVLMVSAILCERVIQSYSGFLSVAGALGILVVSAMPLLMDAGGNCGSQSSTMVIRALALGGLTVAGLWKSLWKELRIGLLCGLGLGFVYMALQMLIFHAALSGAAVVGVSLLLTVTLSNALGCVLPLLAHALKMDPALMAGPLISTIADVISLMIMFGIAASIL